MENTTPLGREFERNRQELGKNIEELQNKVKGAADWREQMRLHPWIGFGAAVTTGLLLSTGLSGATKGNRFRNSQRSQHGSYRNAKSKKKGIAVGSAVAGLSTACAFFMRNRKNKSESAERPATSARGMSRSTDDRPSTFESDGPAAYVAT